MTRAELLDRRDVLLGRRVAEEITFGDVSTGAQDDLQRATDIARHMITQWGMSETLGLGTFEEVDRAAFLPGRGTRHGNTARRPRGRSMPRSAGSWTARTPGWWGR
jgi:cell division protease FtsH